MSVSILPWYTHRSGKTWPRVRLSFMVDKIIYPITSSLYRLALSGHVVRHVRGWRGLQRWPWLMEPEQLRDRDSHTYHSSTSFQHVAGAAHEILKMTSNKRAIIINPFIREKLHLYKSKTKRPFTGYMHRKKLLKMLSLISILQAWLKSARRWAFRRQRW